MNRPLTPYALGALAAVVVGVLENLLFGSDSPGTRQTVSVGFFFLFVVGAVALLAVGVVAVVRRVCASEASR